jgi:hypothetical protein
VLRTHVEVFVPGVVLGLSRRVLPGGPSAGTRCPASHRATGRGRPRPRLARHCAHADTRAPCMVTGTRAESDRNHQSSSGLHRGRRFPASRHPGGAEACDGTRVSLAVFRNPWRVGLAASRLRASPWPVSDNGRQSIPCGRLHRSARVNRGAVLGVRRDRRGERTVASKAQTAPSPGAAGGSATAPAVASGSIVRRSCATERPTTCAVARTANGARSRSGARRGAGRARVGGGGAPRASHAAPRTRPDASTARQGVPAPSVTTPAARSGGRVRGPRRRAGR